MAGAFDYTPAPKARRLALMSLAATGVFCILSQLNLKIGGHIFPFSFIPVAIIFLWPKSANPVLSLIGVFSIGLLQDALTGGAYGLWPLLWVSLFLIYRPDLKETVRSLWGQWGLFFLVLVGVSVGHFLIGHFLLRQAASAYHIAMSFFMAFVLFPLVWIGREYAAYAFGNRDELFGGEI